MSKLNRYIDTIAELLLNTKAPTQNVKIFRWAVYSIFLLKIIFLFPEWNTFFDEVRQAGIINFHRPLNWVAQIVFLPLFSGAESIIMVAMAFLVALGLIFNNRVLAILIFVASLNYATLLSSATNGGDLILGFFVFMLIFLSSRTEKTAGQANVSNAAWLMLKVNICAVYFLNGYGKLFKKIWLNGDAMLATWNLDYYANLHLVPNWFFNSSVCLLMGWFVIAFELSFPFLIWLKVPRKFLLPIGILFHVFIGLFLSLPDFALTMLTAYILFIDFTPVNKGIKKAALSGAAKLN